MRCVKCGEDTRVTDSRDDRSDRNDWLLKAGARVFGWWSNDFRLRKRQCISCESRETTIEITLSDLEDSFADLRTQLTITEPQMKENKIHHLTQDALESLAIRMIPHRAESELALTKATAYALVSEILFRRQRQKEAQNEGA